MYLHHYTIGAQYAQYASSNTGPLNNAQPPHTWPSLGGIYNWQLWHCLSGIGDSSTYPNPSRFLISDSDVLDKSSQLVTSKACALSSCVDEAVESPPSDLQD